MNLEGKAEMGVSILLLFPLLLPNGRSPCPVLIGGAGLAKGLGGPVAPALSMALAEGEGGGSTTPEWFGSLGFAGGLLSPPPPPLECRADATAEPSSASSSDCSAGIWTLSWGRLPPWEMLFVRDGGAKSGVSGCWWGLWEGGGGGAGSFALAR